MKYRLFVKKRGGSAIKAVLRDIQETVILYADILAQILKVDVTIVDNKMNRIAGSGQLVKEINSNMAEEGHIFRHAMKTGETQIITDPGNHEVCLSCSTRSNCREKFHMCTPIMIDGIPIGGIAFVCFTQQQRKHALKNQDVFAQFLKQFAELITMRARDYLEKKHTESVANLLETVIDKIDFGVIVFQNDHRIMHINTVGKQILRIVESDIISNSNILLTGNKIMGLDEYALTLSTKVYKLIGRVFDIDIDRYSSIFLFHEAERAQRPLAIVGKTVRGVSRIVGESPKILELKQQLVMLASSPSPVLIAGESGTETKEYACAMHEESDRQSGPLIIMHCTTTPKELMEEDLFGYSKTGESAKGKPGKIEAAAKGTLVLEEISDLTLPIQQKLLSVLEDQVFMRVGAKKHIKSNTRIIATTERNILQLVESGAFLKALYYRLNVIPVYIPPLRHRGEDIIILARKFLEKATKSTNKAIQQISPDFWGRICRYQWPGNLWELQNAMEYAVNIMRLNGEINAGLLPKNISVTDEENSQKDFNLEAIEKRTILQALKNYGNQADSKQQVADSLGIGIATLYRKLKRYGIK